MAASTDDVPEIPPDALVRALEAGEPLQVVDVRSAERVAAGRIELGGGGRFVHLVGSQLLARTSLAAAGLAAGVPIVAVCGRGNDSRTCAAHLRSLGADARSLAGGMVAYMKVVVARELAPAGGLDRLVQLDRVGKGSLAYLLTSDGEAVVIDPARDLAPLLAAAREAGARVVAAIDTHAHADYISGATALARATGAPYHLHPADASYAYDGTPGRLAITPLVDGGRVRFGRCALDVWHTPGHTLGSASLLLGDALAFTGDFVFVDSLGRPDLGSCASDWAPVLWDSLERAKRDWPARALVLPAHYASAAERNADRSVGRPFGELLGSNAALRIADREAFLAWAGRPTPFPEAYRVIKAINVGLTSADEDEADELEAGRNECAVSRPPSPPRA